MILIINVCKERLHYYEFVKPVEDILKGAEVSFVTKHHKDLIDDDLAESDKAIICGTSLKDFDYKKNLKSFSWIKSYDKPLLGICAGMQLLGMTYGSTNSREKLEIGYFKEEFTKAFLGVQGEQEVYHLHQSFSDFTELEEFEIYAGKEISQAVKHKEKPFYGVLFHPEVRNKQLITTFAAL